MRLRPLTLCLLPLLLIGCSTVRVKPTGAAGNAPAVPVRNDRAATQDFPAADNDGYRPPTKLAVLLPMSGSLAPAAASVRDGFLAAYYAETRRRPAITFYDTKGSGAGAQAALGRALADGTQLIVGPLGRDEVNAVNGQANNSVPIIALNRSSALPPKGSTGFALLPDDEGAAAADRLLDRGVRSVLVFSNRSDNAQRALTAFRQAFTARGGSIASEVALSGDTPSLTAQLAALQAGPNPPKAVFLALEAGQARAITAQLRASVLADLPRISTSLILSGANSRADAELDGTEFPELPWLLGQGGSLPDAAALAKSLPSARGPAQRLFAFGADAWKLAAYFERLYNDPGFSVHGATGELSIDIAGPVHRVPSWAVFSGGRGRAARGSDGPTPAP
jgi:outer membrane PBP1 activator LpoA protein